MIVELYHPIEGTSFEQTFSFTSQEAYGTRTEESMKFPTSTLIPPKKKKKKRRLQHTAKAYTEDLVLEALSSKRSKKEDVGADTSNFSVPLTSDEEERRRKRMARFNITDKKARGDDTINGSLGEPKALSLGLSSSRDSNLEELKTYQPRDRSNDDKKLVGTCTDLEKPYLRLTTFPKSENVRPLPVLVKSLGHIKNRYIQTEDFEWANEQLKSVRQDVTVQRLRNKFVLEVYETHARLLLEHGDLAEFHQCQTMIRSLTHGSSCHDDEDCEPHHDDNVDAIHDDEVTGTLTCLRQTEEATDEFLAYGLLYALVQNSGSELTRALSPAYSQKDLTFSSSLSDGERPVILRGSSYRHALQVVKAVIHYDYQTFFRLYECAPHMSAYLMDFLVRRVRNAAFERIIAAYRPTISVEHLREALLFQDLEETRRFLKKNGAVFMHEQIGPPFWVDCKASVSSLAAR